MCKKLFPDYYDFIGVENWGDPNLLVDAINEVEAAMNGSFSYEEIKKLHRMVDKVIPDTEEFPELMASLALNASCAVLETLVYVID